MKTRIKICGITSVQDAGIAVAAGTDAIGLVFYPQSPRYVDLQTARQVIDALPPFITSVGLFVDADDTLVQQTLAQLPLDLLQFHGNEPALYCASFQRPYIKAIRVRHDTDLHALCAEYESASGLLLDSYTKGLPGGTGETFNWDLIPQDLPLPIILAGGLNAQNVAAAISDVDPYGVDVSSGVELAPGRKDESSVHAFVVAVSDANQRKGR